MQKVRMVSESEYVSKSPEVVIVPATSAHVRALMADIRDKDRQEIESFGITMEKGVWRSFKHGLMNRTALIDGKVAAMWGCGGVYMGQTGQVWLLTTTEVKKVSPLRFARIYQQEVLAMLQVFELLENFVSDEYNEAKRLLSICGFTLEEPEKVGNGMYRRFWRVA